MAEFKTVKAQRTTIRKSVTKTCHELENLLQSDPSTITREKIGPLAAVLREKAERLYSLDDKTLSLMTEQESIDTAIEEEVSRTEEYRETITSLSERVSMYFQNLPEPAKSSIAGDSTESRPSSYSNLPKLQLPTFNGDYLEWRSFWDNFAAAVHDIELPAVRKFAYLSSCLRGPAKESIRGMPVTATNYASAVQLLKRRFGNPNMLIGLHANQLVSTPLVVDGDVPAFRRLIDTFDASLREIEQLIEEVRGGGSRDDIHDLLLAPLLIQKLPTTARVEWQRRNSDPIERYDLKKLREFVRSEVETLESLRTVSINQPSHQVSSTTSSQHKRPKGLTASLKIATVPLDHQQHRIWQLPLNERLPAVKQRGLCINCLGKHSQSDCFSQNTCRVCQKKHHTCLHEVVTSVNDKSAVSLNCKTTQSSQPRILLQTVSVFIKGPDGRERKARALIDSGSEQSYITNEAAQFVKASPIEQRKFAIESFGSNLTRVKDHQRILVVIRSCHNSTEHSVKLWKTDRLCNAVRGLRRDEFLPCQFHGLQLADNLNSDDLEIDIILGADCSSALFNPVAPMRSGNLSAWSTIFGWVISGQPKGDSSSHLLSTHHACLFAKGQYSPTDFWDLELLGVAKNEESGNHADFPTPIWNGDRYQLSLPWIDQARPRLSKEHAFSRNKSFFFLPANRKDRYLATFDEWTELGILEPADDHAGNFLPHHSVIQGDKLRVAIDGSAKD